MGNLGVGADVGLKHLTNNDYKLKSQACGISVIKMHQVMLTI